MHDVSTTSSAMGRCLARAAIAGNPSDLHFGAVLSTPLANVAASVVVAEADGFELPGVEAGAGSVGELAESISSSAAGDRPLAAAAIVAAAERFDVAIRPVRVDVSTQIPRGVGLAGSSAIVIATLRGLAKLRTSEVWTRRLVDDPVIMATVALAAENEVLGITAGLQDRLVQSVGSAVLMDFSATPLRPIAASDVRPIPTLPGHWFVAYRSDHSGDSGAVHRGADTGTSAFRTAMRSLATQAHDAAAAVEVGDVSGLRRSMDATFDLRSSCMQLQSGHVEMVMTARELGSSATYTGSGGAVTVLSDDLRIAQATRTALAQLGCGFLELS